MSDENGDAPPVLNKHNLSIARLACLDDNQWARQGGTDMVKVLGDRTQCTNGHRAILVTNRTAGKTEGFTIPARAIAAILRLIKRKPRPKGLRKGRGYERWPTLTAKIEDGHIGVRLDSFEARLPVSTTQPTPDIIAAIPKGAPTVSVRLSLKELMPVLQWFAEFETSETPNVIVKLWNDSAPIRIEAVNKETGQVALAIVMPMRMKQFGNEGEPDIVFPGIDNP